MNHYEETRQRFNYFQIPDYDDFTPNTYRQELASLTASLGEAVTDVAGVAVLSPVLEVKVAAALVLLEICESYCTLLKRSKELGIRVVDRVVRDPMGGPSDSWMGLEEISASITQPALEMIRKLVASGIRVAEWRTLRLLERKCLPNLVFSEEIIDSLRHLPINNRSMKSMGARDERYSVFSNTREYDEASIGDADPEQTREVFNQARIQRDELDAIETFARVVAAESLDMQTLLDLSQIVADEGRHCMAGELMLAELGANPFDVPVGIIGSEIRRSMSPWNALSQICLVGETGNLRNILQSALLASSTRLPLSETLLTSIYLDERSHIAVGTHTLRTIFPGVGTKTLQEQALSATGEYLVQHNAVQRRLTSAAEVGRFIGE